jgi:hypothetical protein
MITFWIYTLLVLQWSRLIGHDSFAGNKNGNWWIKWIFGIANIVVAAVVIIYFISIVLQYQPVLFSKIAAITLCIVYSVTALSFLFYGAALHQELGAMKKNSSRTGPEETCGIQTRIKAGAFSVSISFMVESFIFASSVSADTSKEDGILSFFDMWALFTILLLYWQGVNAKVVSRASQSPGMKNRKTGSRKNSYTENSKVSKMSRHDTNPKIELENAFQTTTTADGSALSSGFVNGSNSEDPDNNTLGPGETNDGEP